MDCWAVLGIDRASGEGAVKAAYMRRLPQNHPEDNPEGFKALRAAYEAALSSLAENAAEDGATGDETPEGRLLEEVKAILKDFSRRVTPSSWEAAINDETCGSLDAQYNVGRMLLNELMDDYYIPNAVWKYIDGVLDFSGREAEIRRRYPARFADCVMNGIKYEESLRAAFFEPPLDRFEPFMELYYQLAEAFSNGDFDRAAAIKEDVEKTGLSHPDMDILLLGISVSVKNPDHALARRLIEKHPGDYRVRFALGRFHYETDDCAGALVFLEDCLKEHPEDSGVKTFLAAALNRVGDYERCKALIREVLIESPYFRFAGDLMRNVCETLINVYKAALKKNPKDEETVYKLAACYYNTERYAEGLKLIKRRKPGKEYSAKHHELYFDFAVSMGGGFLRLKPKLLESLKIWEENETDRIRLKRLPYNYYVIDEDEAALSTAQRYLKEFPEDPQICAALFQIYRKRKDFSAAIKAAEDCLRLHPDELVTLNGLAELYRELEDDASALEYIRRAIYHAPSSLCFRLSEMKILYDHGEWENLKDAAGRAVTFGGETPETTFYSAAAAYKTGGSAEKAAEAIKTFTAGRPGDKTALELLAEIELALNRCSASAETYSKIINIDASPYYNVRRAIALCRINRLDEARKDLRAALAKAPDYAYAHYQMGLLNLYADDIEEARSSFADAVNLNRDELDYRLRLIHASAKLGDMAAAISAAGEALARFTGPEDRRLVNSQLIIAYLINGRAGEGYALKDSALGPGGEAGSETYRFIGECAARLSLDGEAREWFSAAVAKDPDNPQNRRVYAFFLRVAAKDYKSALEQYTAAERLGAVWADGVNIARLALALGDEAEAKKRFRQSWVYMAAVIRKKADPCACCLAAESALGLNERFFAAYYAWKAVRTARRCASCPSRACHAAYFVLARVFAFWRRVSESFINKAIQIYDDREYIDFANPPGGAPDRR
jgi:tetratricopeptide (TPR) repeat protein